MPDPMEHEARTQALIHISKVHREAMQNRFKTEWWIIASIVTLSLYAYINIDKAPLYHIKSLILMALLILDILGIYTLSQLHSSHRINREIFITSEIELAEVNVLKTTISLIKVKKKRDRKKFHQIFKVQVFILLVLSALNLKLLVFSPGTPQADTKQDVPAQNECTSAPQVNH